MRERLTQINMKSYLKKELGNLSSVLNVLLNVNAKNKNTMCKTSHYEDERDYRQGEYERIEWVRHGLGLEYNSFDSLWYWEELMRM